RSSPGTGNRSSPRPPPPAARRTPHRRRGRSARWSPAGRIRYIPDMRIYTRTGDRGETGLFGGGRVKKSHPRVEAFGGVDELNSVVGWAVTTVSDPEIRARLGSLQPDLFTIGAHLATPATNGRRPRLPELPNGRVEEFERWIDEAAAELPEIRAFILPGGTPGAAALHVARTVCRRAERRVVELAAEDHVE